MVGYSGFASSGYFALELEASEVGNISCIVDRGLLLLASLSLQLIHFVLYHTFRVGIEHIDG